MCHESVMTCFRACMEKEEGIFGVITSLPMEMPHLGLGAGGNRLRKEKTPENRVLEGFANWRPHGDSNPGYCRERAVS